MKVLITGATGQVGRALALCVPPQNSQAVFLDRARLDLTDERAIARTVADLEPDVVINAAAYTAVDKAESDPVSAQAGNADALKWLAEAVRRLPDSRLIHISTDFVFDGMSSVPYAPDAPAAPVSVYGRTKLSGEKFATEILGARALVLRTSWVYDASGRNFLNTMLRLMREGKPLRVVADQVGTPTWAGSIAEVLWRFAGRADLSGIWHWSDAGIASWYDFAVAIAEEAHARGMLERMPQVTPISSAEYPTPAKRPNFSVLDKRATIDAIGVPPVHWRQNLRRVIEEKRVA